jgi:hypothetical protein
VFLYYKTQMKLINWNIWGMPFVNPNSYSSSVKSIQETVNIFDENSGLQIFSIQECWVWRAGAFHWITKNLIEQLPNKLLSIMHVLSVLLTSFIFPHKYNPLEYVELPHNLYVYQDTHIKCGKIMNSGLAIITNKEADESGFEYFNSNDGLEKIASKGFQFIYYDDINTIIINTHLQSGKNTILKMEQLLQIKEFINPYEHSNLYINGDFNLNIEDIADDAIARTLGQKKINGIEETTRGGKSYDHCYTNDLIEFGNISYEIVEDNKSDHHKLIVNVND